MSGQISGCRSSLLASDATDVFSFLLLFASYARGGFQTEGFFPGKDGVVLKWTQLAAKQPHTQQGGPGRRGLGSRSARQLRRQVTDEGGGGTLGRAGGTPPPGGTGVHHRGPPRCKRGVRCHLSAMHPLQGGFHLLLRNKSQLMSTSAARMRCAAANTYGG